MTAATTDFDLGFARALAGIAHLAGAAVMEVYGGRIEVETKSDDTPVTEADQAAEDIILRELASLAPDIPVISEEAAEAGQIPDVGQRFMLVDPLDGTREFINRNGEFTINIAAIRDGRAVAGTVYAPARERMFFAAIGGGAFEVAARTDAALDLARARAIHARTPPPAGLCVATSRSHRNSKVDAFLADYAIADTVRAGSSLKFCLIAAGEADIYPRLGRTMEWDTAAGHAILAAAGGQTVTLDGADLYYGKIARGYDNPHFVACGWRGGLKPPGI